MGNKDVFIARYDERGRLRWLRQSGANGGDVPLAVSRDARGGLFIGGKTLGTSEDWLARHDGAGERVWSIPLALGPFGDSGCVAPDGNGGAFAGGRIKGTYGGPYSGPGLSDAWLGRFDEAEAAFRRVLELRPGMPGIHAALASLHLRGTRDLDAAEAAWQEEARLRPDDPAVWSLRGDLLHERGRDEEAVAAYARGFGAGDRNPAALTGYASALL